MIDELRYGISALDMQYKEDALNDELLVNGKNGQIRSSWIESST